MAWDDLADVVRGWGVDRGPSRPGRASISRTATLTDALEASPLEFVVAFVKSSDRRPKNLIALPSRRRGVVFGTGQPHCRAATTYMWKPGFSTSNTQPFFHHHPAWKKSSACSTGRRPTASSSTASAPSPSPDAGLAS